MLYMTDAPSQGLRPVWLTNPAVELWKILNQATSYIIVYTWNDTRWCFFPVVQLHRVRVSNLSTLLGIAPFRNPMQLFRALKLTILMLEPNINVFNVWSSVAHW